MQKIAELTHTLLFYKNKILDGHIRYTFFMPTVSHFSWYPLLTQKKINCNYFSPLTNNYTYTPTTFPTLQLHTNASNHNTITCNIFHIDSIDHISQEVPSNSQF